MIWLALDTSQALATVALVRDHEVLAAHVLGAEKRHAEALVDAVDQVLLSASLTMDAITGVAAGVGPGSFIGVRSGLAFAKGLALARDLPLLGLPSLVALAASADLASRPDAPRMLEAGVIVDAKRGELFAQRLRGGVDGWHAIGEPVAIAITDSAPLLLSMGTVFANAAHAPLVASAGATWVNAPSISGEGLARALSLRLAAQPGSELHTVVPVYVRPPDAQLPQTDPNARRAELLPDQS